MISAARLAAEAVAACGPLARDRHVRILALDPVEQVMVAGDAIQLRTALVNLLRNGVEAAPAREQGTGVGFADLRDHERRDDRGKDAQAGLGESEAVAGLGDDQIAHGAQPHPAAERGSLHALNIIASDRPGLLYGLARTLARYKINLHTARINTLGDRAEDVFLISGNALTNSKIVLQLEQDLLQELSLQPATGAVLEPAVLK